MPSNTSKPSPRSRCTVAVFEWYPTRQALILQKPVCVCVPFFSGQHQLEWRNCRVFLTLRRGYRAHTTKLLTRITDDSPFDKMTAILTIEQLHHKQTILEDLDAKIAPFIDNEADLEAEIIEAEETRTKILDGIACLTLKLNRPLTKPIEPQPVPKNPTSAPLSAASDAPVSIISTSHTVSPTTSHAPHISDDEHPTLEAAACDPIYTAASINSTTQHTTVVSSSSYATSRLPKLSIPTFTGDPLTW